MYCFKNWREDRIISHAQRLPEHPVSRGRWEVLFCCTRCFITSKLLTPTPCRIKADHWTKKPKTMLPKASGKIKLTRGTFIILWLNKDGWNKGKKPFFPVFESLVKLLHSAQWVTQHDKHHCLSYNSMAFYSTKQEHLFSGKYCVFLMNYLIDAKYAEFKWNVCTRGSQKKDLTAWPLIPCKKYSVQHSVRPEVLL